MTERTRVVDIRSHEWTITPEDGRVYIGRANARYRFQGSPWRNPHYLTAGCTRAEALAQYGRYLLRRSDLIQRIVPELRGKVLGCWCAPRVCHGDTLARLADHDGELGPLCPVCLEREIDVEDCWSCGGVGWFHPADENPTEYEPDEYEPCLECCGTGVLYACTCEQWQQLVLSTTAALAGEPPALAQEG